MRGKISMYFRLIVIVCIIGLLVFSCTHQKQVAPSTDGNVVVNRKPLLISFSDVSNEGVNYHALASLRNSGGTFAMFNPGEKVFPSFQGGELTNVIFLTANGAPLKLIAKMPDGQFAKVIVPNGQGFSAAKLITSETEKPLMINVNSILRVLDKNDVDYLEETMMVSPIIQDEQGGPYISLNKDDIKTINEKLKTKHDGLQIRSSKSGLEVYR